MLEITTKNFGELNSSGKPLVIDFGAEWCAPCRSLSPLMNDLAREYAGRVNIGQCDVEENNELAVKFKIRNVPTILFIRNGEVSDTIVGAVSREAIRSKINQLV